jgi:integrase
MSSRQRRCADQGLVVAPSRERAIKTYTPRVQQANTFARHLLEVRLTKVEQRFPEASVVRATLRCASHYGDDTLAEYARHLARWWAWCVEHSHDPLDPNPAVLAIWVSEMLERYVWATVKTRLGAIRLLYRVQCGFDLYDTATRRWSGPLHNIILSARRDPKTNPSVPRRLPLTISRVKDLLAVQFNPISDVRDAALITLGFGGGLPAPVLRRMRFEWVEDRDDRLYIHHDAPGYSSPFAVAAGAHEQTCPIRTYRRWTALRRRITGVEEGYVFTRVTRYGEVMTEPRLSSHGLNSILFVRSVAAGIDPPVRPSDMRATAVAELGALNLSDTRFLLEAGAVSPSTAARYNRARHAVEARKEQEGRRSVRGVPRSRR